MRRNIYLLTLGLLLATFLGSASTACGTLSLCADANNDGAVNILDLITVVRCIGELPSPEEATENPLENENQELKAENERLSAEIKKLNSEIESLNTQIGELTAEIENLNATIQKLQEEIDECCGCRWDDLAATEPPYTAAQIIDGDTILLTTGHEIRYIGIDTPEVGQKYHDEAAAANGALVMGRDLRFEFDEEKCDKYGRVLAYVFAGETFVNLELIKMGHARTLSIPPNTKYQEEFVRAEDTAKQQGVGLWAKEPPPPPDDPENIEITEIDAVNEWVRIVNNGMTAVNMTGCTLADAANHVYTFPEFTFPAGGVITVYTGIGEDNADSLYWGLKSSIWNNGGDTATLLNAGGELLDEYTY